MGELPLELSEQLSLQVCICLANLGTMYSQLCGLNPCNMPCVQPCAMLCVTSCRAYVPTTGLMSLRMWGSLLLMH